MTPNQGPTIGVPNHPSQLFSNPAIRIIGCGFSGATAVLFGATPAASFPAQSDSILYAAPPTPASGTVDVRVVTPLGTRPLARSEERPEGKSVDLRGRRRIKKIIRN